MHTVITVILVLAGIGLVSLVLIQQGKGADMGAAFGSGSSTTVFGARGSASFLTRTTGVFAMVFFATCLLLGYFIDKGVEPVSVIEKVRAIQQQEVPEIEQSSEQVYIPAQVISSGPTSAADVPTVPELEPALAVEKDQAVEGDKNK